MIDRIHQRWLKYRYRNETYVWYRDGKIVGAGKSYTAGGKA